MDYKTPGELKIPGNDTWYDSAWKYRRRIEIDNTEQGELDHFPVLVVLEHKVNIDYLKAQSDDGYDLRFTDSDGTTLIPHDVERWDQGGKSYIWVKIPQIKDHQKDYFYMYYGNLTATDSRNPGQVWDNKYVGVWHLNETPSNSGRHSDSTTSGNNGTLSDASSNIKAGREGISGLAQNFDGTEDEINMGSGSSLQFTTQPFSLSAWIKLDPARTSANFYQVFSTDNTTTGYGLLVTDTNKLRFALRGTSGTFTDSNSDIERGKWVHIGAVYNGTGSSRTIYINGGKDIQASITGSLTTSTNNFYIGRRSNTSGAINYFIGDIDEARLSNTARDDSWFKAEYKSETNTYLTFGSEELFGSELLSSVFDAGHNAAPGSSGWGYLSYDADEPEKTAAKVKVRTGNNMYLADAADFATCESIINKTDISSNKCVRDGDRYIQYQVILESTEVNKTPIFKSISVTDFLPQNIKPVIKGISTVATPPSPVIDNLDFATPKPAPMPSPSPSQLEAEQLIPNFVQPIWDFIEALFK